MISCRLLYRQNTRYSPQTRLSPCIGNELHKFCEKKLHIFCKQPVKESLHNFSFSWLKIRLFKILQKFLHIWNGMVKGFSKMYNLSFFGQIFFCKHFYCKTGFCDKKFNFRKFAISVLPQREIFNIDPATNKLAMLALMILSGVMVLVFNCCVRRQTTSQEITKRPLPSAELQKWISSQRTSIPRAG